VFGLLFRGAGGGDVSGGGTLYMKGGAGRNSTSRVLKARADRETHTHLSFSSPKYLKNVLKYSEF
jgi:hypothetical protein